jgi:hypothetical protein
MVTEPKCLLIMACSQRKRLDPGLLPAIERYNTHCIVSPLGRTECLIL